MITKTITLNSFPVCVKKSGRACTDYHNHKYYELVYVLEGMVDHIINGEHHVLREGNYVLLSPSDGHMYVSVNDAPFGVINFMFDPVLIDSNFSLDTPFNEIIKHPLIGMSAKKLTSLPLAMQFSDDSRSLRAVFTDSLTEYKQKKFGYVNTLRANAVKALIACLRNVYSDNGVAEKSAFVDTIIQYVNSNYSEDICLTALCREIGYNVQYVSRVFKTQIGLSFSDYLKRVRVQKACSLLLSTEMTVQQIVNKVGYSNMAFFYRAFKEITGETPADFRKK